MDQLPLDSGGYANNNAAGFADSQQYNAFDNFFPSGADQNPYDASWGVNASGNPAQSRVQNVAGSAWPTHSTSNSNAQPAAYGRPISHSPNPYGQTTFSAYPPPAQHYQYRHPQYDPALTPQHAFGQNFNYPTTSYEIPNATTIAPHALQQERRSPAFAQNAYNPPSFQTTTNLPQLQAGRPAVPVDHTKLRAAIPDSTVSGRFSIIDFDDLAQATNSQRMGNFINVGTESFQWDINRATIPPYAPRKSRNELRKQATNDPKLLARLGKTGAKKQRLLAVASKTPPAKVSSPSGERIKYEGDTPSQDESSSDDTDDESSYTSDDDTEAPPLPEARPSNPREATEYDTIKALWRGKRRSIPSDSIRKGLGEFWEIVKTIRDRWKVDVAAAQDAESKNRTNELPLLQSRVKDQRDMLETAFKAALKHGHPAILELMSENLSLLYLCYQFLLDRHKAEDYNGPLPRILLETMSLFTTITDHKLETTHMVKVLPRFVKKGDAKTQFYAKRIISNAAAASKSGAGEQSTKKAASKDGNAPSPTTGKVEPEASGSLKRSASTAGDGSAPKKLATAASKSTGSPTTTKPVAVARKTASAGSEVKAASSAASTTPKAKVVVAKPSGLFASLQSAAKKPGTSLANKAAQPVAAAAGVKPLEKASNSTAPANTQPARSSTFSFAETMANLSRPKDDKPAAKLEKQVPQETAAEKAKRLRKESRRHLHVSFKAGEDLVQIREFSHDPEEEVGHDANQMRDLADVGGEGRMFKQQHHIMDLDDDDEIAEEDSKLVTFTPPIDIDFSTVDPEDRKRNFSKFGGGELEPESQERSVRRQYEANTLIVFYANPTDVPPNPREPSDPFDGESVSEVKRFGLPENKWIQRGKTSNHDSSQQQQTSQSRLTAGFDFSQIAGITNNYQASPQPPVPSSDAISNILASLKAAQTNQGMPAAPAPVYQAPPPAQIAFQPQATASLPNGQPDLAAILAQIQSTQPGQAPAPAMGTYGGFGAAATPSMAAFQSGQPQQSAAYENPERKQWRETGNESVVDKARRQQDPAQNPRYRTKVCKYWQEGRCQKGSLCSYKHEEA